MCTKLSIYLSALLIAANTMHLANLNFLRKLEEKYKLARFSYYITGSEEGYSHW